MNIHNIRLYFSLAVAAFALGACTDGVQDDITVGGSTPEVSEVSRLRLSVGSVIIDPVTPGTRSTDTQFQNDTFAPGTEIGIFILTENTYADYLAASSRPYGQGGPAVGNLPQPDDDTANLDITSTVVTDAYRDGLHYGYENIRAVVSSDGTITRADGLDFIYPLNAANRIAIIAYAPYDETTTYTGLVRGMPATAAADQSGNEGVRRSDLLIGTPAIGNPFREAGDVPVSLFFRHVMSSVRLNLDLTDTPELRSDSIIISLSDVVCADTLLVMPTAAAIVAGESHPGIFLDTPWQRFGRVTLARAAGLGSSPAAASLSLSCSAIVVPHIASAGIVPTFAITFKGRSGGRADTTIVRADPSADIIFRSGSQRVYRAVLPSSADDGEGETLPDDGKDDIILGKPRK